MKRNYQQDLPYPVEVKYAVKTECSAAAAADDQSVILYDRANFEGLKRNFGVGKHRLSNVADFNDLASSIRVPPGLVVIVYEHADAGGGYGRSIDFMEEQPDLSKYNFDNQISYLQVFRSERPWVRNRLNNGSFEAGHFQMAGQPAQYNPNPLIAPPKPPNVATQPPPRTDTTQPPRTETPPPPVFCSLTGQVKDYSFIYASTFTLILYRSDGSATQFSTKITGGQYTIPNVPEGTYELRSTGYYKPTKQIITTDGSRSVTCEGGRSNSVTFKIGPGEG